MESASAAIASAPQPVALGSRPSQPKPLQVVLTASSAAQAFDLLQRIHVDVLLADVAMPGEDGYQLVRRIRASSASAIASIPAAALTAFARDEDRQQALRAGFQVHLAKPVDGRSLVAAVADLGKIQAA